MATGREHDHELILREVFRHTPVGVALLDLHGTIFETNTALAKLLDVDRTQLAGLEFETLVDDDHRRDLADLLSWLREGRIETTAVTLRLVRPDGDRVTVNLRISAVESTDEDPAWCVAFVEDVEQRVLMENRLRDSEDRYRRIVEDQTDLICRSTPEGILLFVNDAWCRHSGVRREDALGRSFYEFIEEGDRDRVRRKIASLTPDNPVSTGEQKGMGPDGRVTWQSWTDRGFFDAAGRLVELQSVGRDITEEREANERLRLSEERYRRIVEDQTDLISRSKPDGTLLFVNDAYCRHFGVRSEDVLGVSFFEFIEEVDREAVRQKIASLHPQHPVREEEHRVIEEDGRVGWQHWIDRGFFDGDGNLVELQSVGRDVTESHDARESLTASEERYRTLFRNLPIPAWESDWSEIARGLQERGIRDSSHFPSRVSETIDLFEKVATKVRVQVANEKALELAGVGDLPAFEAWLPTAATPDSIRRQLRGVEGILLRGERTSTVPLTFVSVNGVQTDVLATYTRLAEGDDWRMIITVQDLTEITRIGRELREREEMMSRVEAAAGTGSWEWNPQTDMIRGSAEFWKIIQGRAGGEVERPLRESFRVVHPDDQEAIGDLVRQALDPTSARPASQKKEFRLVRPDGSIAIARAQIFYWYGSRGAVDRAFGTLQDVSAVKHAEADAERHREEMIRADKMISLGILVSGVAHEINNPNHSIMLNLPLLRDAWRDAVAVLDEIDGKRELTVASAPWKDMRDEIPDVIRDIEQASERIRNIVEELKGFATDRDRGARGPMAINIVVRTALRLLANIIRKSTRHLHVELADGLPNVAVSPQRIEQVIVNLVVNACQALESPDKAIRVQTATEGDHVLVRVIDEGAGISADDLRKITDPFFTTKRASGGTGLGLAVSQRIVEDHGGRLTFESEPGRGTTATLWIPVGTTEVANE